MANNPARRAKRFYSDTVFYYWEKRAEVVGISKDDFRSSWELAAQSQNPRQDIGAIQANIKALEDEITKRR